MLIHVDRLECNITLIVFYSVYLSIFFRFIYNSMLIYSEIDQRIQLEALMSPSDLATWLRAWIHDFSRLIPTIKWARSDLFFMYENM